MTIHSTPTFDKAAPGLTLHRSPSFAGRKKRGDLWPKPHNEVLVIMESDINDTHKKHPTKEFSHINECL